jgi:hypothetical protein
VARRYYLSPLTGDGTPFSNAHRPTIAQVPGASWRCVLPHLPDGHPRHQRALVAVDGTAAVLQAVAALGGVMALPDLPLSTLVSALSTPQRNALANVLEAAGATPPEPGETLHEILNRIGLALDPGFDGTVFEEPLTRG